MKNMTAMTAAMDTMTYEDLLEMLDSRDLPLTEPESGLEVEEERMEENRPEEKEESGEEYPDFSRTDYEAVYTEVCSLSESLVPLVEEIRSCPPPRQGEIPSLLRQMQEGSSAARDRLILSHMRMVLKIALSLSRKYGLDIEDAVSAGSAGLITAADRYHPEISSSFDCFAWLYILRAIQRECRPVWSYRYVPAHAQEKMAEVYVSCLQHAGGAMEESALKDREMLREISGDLDLSLEKTEKYLNLFCTEKYGKSSLEDLREADAEIGSGSCLAYDDSSLLAGPEEEDLNACIEESLELLSPKQARVLSLRFGLEDGREHTLEEIGREYHVTRERIRQIEEKALKKLGRSSCSRKLKEFLE